LDAAISGSSLLLLSVWFMVAVLGLINSNIATVSSPARPVFHPKEVGVR
jgi:hypothetical protein